MIMPLGIALSSVLIDVLLAVVALFVGFFVAIWYLNYTNAGIFGAGKNGDSDNDKSEKANEAERANMAAMKLRDLAHNMATDVGDHCVLVENITGKLGALSTDGSQDNRAAVSDAVSQILGANEQLQDRLEDAERKIQAQAEEIRAQQSEARTDSLTELANRRAFDDEIAKGVEEFHVKNLPCSLLIFDIDHFKKFNDTHGHQAGDEVLRRVGRKTSRIVKSSDLACRYGGEEFAVVLRNTDLANAQVAAERVREAIEDLTVQFEDKRLRVTASIGLAELTTNEDSTKLIRRADEAVYASKAAGRNCGHWHDGEKCLPIDAESNRAPQIEVNTEPPRNQSCADKTTSSDFPKVVSLDSLPDQSVFSDELRRRISESHRFGVSLSVIHLQVKDYQILESTYGNAVGHLLLDSVAQYIKLSLRDMDLLGKLDLGEFIVMLPGSSGHEADLVGKRIRSTISNCVIPLGENRLSLELLIGLTTVEPHDDATRMMARAKQIAEEANESETATVVG